MSKNRLGIYTNLNLSNLNKADNIVNTTGLLDDCEVILFTSSEMKNAITLNTSDPTSPKVIKQSPSEDKKDTYIFRLVANKEDKKVGYLLQAINGGWFLNVNSNNKQLFGSKSYSSVWLITSLGGKEKLKCKFRLSTTNGDTLYMAEKGDNIVVTSDDTNTQWNMEFTKFGDKAFQAVLYDNKAFQQFCCDGKGKTSICKLEGFTSDSSKCKALGPEPSFRYLEDNFEEEDDYLEDDMTELDDYGEDDYGEDDFEEDDMSELDDYGEDDYLEEEFEKDTYSLELSDANINVKTISKNVLLSLIIALVIIIVTLGIYEFKFKH